MFYVGKGTSFSRQVATIIWLKGKTISLIVSLVYLANIVTIISLFYKILHFFTISDMVTEHIIIYFEIWNKKSIIFSLNLNFV